MRVFAFDEPGPGLPCLITIQKATETITFTTWDRDVTVSDVLYVTAPSADVTGFNFPSDGTPASADVAVMATEGGLFNYGDGVRGLLDGWPISIAIFDPANLPAGASTVISGVIGAVDEDVNGLLIIAANGPLRQAQARPLADHYSLICRADLGDDECKVDLVGDGWQLPATGEATGAYTIVLDSLPDGRASDETWYVDGGLFVLSGVLDGYPKLTIRAWEPGTLTLSLFLPIDPADIPAGTSFEIYPGCDRTRDMCFVRFNNIVNMRAETFVPQPDFTASIQQKKIDSIGVDVDDLIQRVIDG